MASPTASNDNKVDPAQLRARLDSYIGTGGDRSITARWRVTAEAILLATDALGDRNPVYTDETYAKTTPHGGLVAPPSSVLWWHRHMFVPVGSSERVDAEGIPRFRLDPNPIRQVGMRETEMGILGEVVQLLAEAGYSSLAVTNSDTTVVRYPRAGDLLTCFGPRIESIVGPKKTGLGEGYFTTSDYVLRDEKQETVAHWRTSRLHFAPA